MGYYLETASPKNKAQQLIETSGATTLPQIGPPTFNKIPPGKVLICVKDNGAFDAAAIIYSARELDGFNDPKDTRPTRWLLMGSGEGDRDESNGRR